MRYGLPPYKTENSYPGSIEDCRNEIIYFFTNKRARLFERTEALVRTLFKNRTSVVRETYSARTVPVSKTNRLGRCIVPTLFCGEKKTYPNSPGRVPATDGLALSVRLLRRAFANNEPATAYFWSSSGRAHAGGTANKYQNGNTSGRKSNDGRAQRMSDKHGRRDETGHAARSTRRVYARRDATRTRAHVLVAVLCGCKHLRPLPCDRSSSAAAAALPRAPRSPLRVLLLYGRPSKSLRNRSGVA